MPASHAFVFAAVPSTRPRGDDKTVWKCQLLMTATSTFPHFFAAIIGSARARQAEHSGYGLVRMYRRTGTSAAGHDDLVSVSIRQPCFRADARTAACQCAACESPKRRTVRGPVALANVQARGITTVRPAWQPFLYVIGSSCAATAYDGMGRHAAALGRGRAAAGRGPDGPASAGTWVPTTSAAAARATPAARALRDRRSMGRQYARRTLSSSRRVAPRTLVGVSAPAPTGSRPREERASGGPSLAFRPDVEGLRAVAILLVVGYHAGLPFLPGGFIGVDVFFVISGFLITGLLLAEVTRSGHVSLARFWARRARRLLPAAVLVLVLTAAVSWLVVPQIDHGLVGGDIVAAAVYVSNLRFAAQATDYLGGDRAPSPVLHFWSLGVEEQFYLAWPLLLLLAAAYVARRAVRARAASSDEARAEAGAAGARSTALLLVVVGLVSFVYSWWLTRADEPWAFFGTPARAWEFAVGGLLAVAAARGVAAPAAARVVLGWAGVAVVLLAAGLLTNDVPYPGTAAVWPVLGTGLIIAAGTSRRSESAGGARAGAGLLLTTWPMRALGRLSYSWYLWHWPVLVLTAAALGPLSVPAKLLLVVLALVPSALAYRFIERPLHHSPSLSASPRRSLLLGLALSLTGVAAGVLLVVGPGGGALASAAPGAASDDEGGTSRSAAPAPLPSSASPSPSPGSTTGRSAPVLAAPATGAAIRPRPDKARDDLPVTYADGCHLQFQEISGGPCAYGRLSSPTSVVLMGDSHAAQWFPALEAAAKARGWKLLSRTKSGCPAPDVTVFNKRLKRAFDECDAWRSALLDTLTGTAKPALVVAASTQTESLVERGTGQRMTGAPAQQEWRDGWTRTLARLSSAGVPVVVVRDTPWPGRDVARCVSQHLEAPSACDVSPAALASTSFDVDLVKGIAGATALDLTPYVCDARHCPAVIGPTLVYRDDNHLTATFSRSLARPLAAALAARIG